VVTIRRLSFVSKIERLGKDYCEKHSGDPVFPSEIPFDVFLLVLQTLLLPGIFPFFSFEGSDKLDISPSSLRDDVSQRQQSRFGGIDPSLDLV